MSGKTVLLLGSFAPSLVHFRGALIAAIAERGHKVVAAAPSISDEVAEKLRQLGAEPRELQLVNASLNPAAMLQSFRQVRALIREIQPDVMISYTMVQLRARSDGCRSEERVMTARGSFHKFATAFVAISMLAGGAASAAPRTVDPLVALSVFGTSESRAAVCAAGAQAAAAAGAAVAAQAVAGQAGCVLPVIDAAPPPVVTEAAPPAPPAAVGPMAMAGGSSIGALPLLVGLAAIVAFAAIVLKHDESDGEINLPISP